MWQWFVMLKIDQQGTIPIYTTLFYCPYIGIVLQTHRATEGNTEKWQLINSWQSFSVHVKHMHLPSMTTWSVSLRTLTVVMMTNIEKTNVQMGSANLYSSPSCNNKTANEISRLNITTWNFLVYWYQRSQTFANICHNIYDGYLYWGWGSAVGVWRIH